MVSRKVPLEDDEKRRNPVVEPNVHDKLQDLYDLQLGIHDNDVGLRLGTRVPLPVT